MNRKVFYAKKGTNPDIDSYSPFFNNYRLNETDLHYQLEKEKITDLYICGIAYDVCVGKLIIFYLINFWLEVKYLLFHLAYTAFDALDLNYRVCVIDDACRGVDLKGIKEQKEALAKRGAILVDSSQVIIYEFCLFVCFK